MSLYEILLIIGLAFIVLGMIPIFGGFIDAIFDMIVDIKKHDYSSLTDLFLGIGVIIILISMIFLFLDKIK